ncbi:MAG: magnesium transporter CorA family protein [Elusimicrobia bacterium]|nr:magnesium transporter CorA family protein [Elusimicrobiota bacterium]
MLKTYGISDNQLVEARPEDSPVWVFISPDDAEKKVLVERFHVDEHNLASALDPDELSRLEITPEHLAIIFKQPKNFTGKGQLLFKVASVGLFLFPDRLVVVMPEDAPLLSGKPFQRVQSLQGVLLKIMAGSIWHFLEHLKVINMITEEIETKISVSMENKFLLNLFSLEKSLVYYLNAINSNGFVFEKLRNAAAKVGFSPENMELLDDTVIENNQCYRQAEIYSNILASLMDARVSIVSNNLNILMKTLNLITICIMVPTLVVSVFSMNVPLPLQHHPLAFWLVMVLAVGSVAVMMFWWRRSASLLDRHNRRR